MSIEVTLIIYSGRPNPSWTLSGPQEIELLERLKRVTTLTLARPSGALPKLGYRGFFVHRPADSPQGGFQAFIHDGIVDRGPHHPSRKEEERTLEQWLLTTARTQLPREVRSHITDEISKSPTDPKDFLSAKNSDCPPCLAADAPAYDPDLWNEEVVMLHNNCYNYANNQITNTFAQPGRASHYVPAGFNCVAYTAAAASDGLIACPDFATALSAGEGWYVALVIWPGVDFHWYRQDNNGCWSHKPGQTEATNLDNGGHPITDPATCNRGNYTDFCTYMITNTPPTVVII